MPKRDVRRLIRAKARAGRHQKRILILLPAERQDLVQHIALVVVLPDCAIVWMLPLRIPALAVDTVDAVHLQPAARDVLGERPDHAAILPLEEPPHGRGEHEHASAFVAEDEQLHIASQRWAEPAMVLAVHAKRNRSIGATRLAQERSSWPAPFTSK